MKFKRGFSLLELLLVVAVVAGIFIFSAPLTMNFYRTQLINDVQSNLIDALQRARHNAVLQKNDSNFGVHIESGSYTLFQTPDLTYASHVSDQDEVFPVVNSIAFEGPTDIIFSKLTGIPVVTGTIAMAYDILVKGVTIDSSGVISKDDSVVFVGGCVATGGTIIESGGYTIHTFTNTGSDTFTVTSGGCDAEVLVVAGGGGAGTSVGGYRGGGGGAGGYVSDNLSIGEGDYGVVVGAGGAVSNNGLNSSFYNLTAIGGGAGGNSQYGVGATGGSGGGAASLQGTFGSGTPGQGYAGGGGSGGYNAGGGGGAGGAALAGWQTACADGGVGISNSISGTAIVYATGGRGTYNCAVSPMVSNRGNGGYSSNTGSIGGGSGIVIVRYPSI